MKKIKIKLTGTRKLMMHNARLANPLDPWTVKKKEVATKKKKTDEDLIKLMQIEARGGVYETHDGLVGIPNNAIYASLFGAAKNFKLGKEFKKAVRYEEGVEPIFIDGKKVDVNKYLNDPANIDYRVVGQQQSKIMRARPTINEGWESEHTFFLDEAVMDERTLKPILSYGGDYVGILEMRPTLGTYKAEIVK